MASLRIGGLEEGEGIDKLIYDMRAVANLRDNESCRFTSRARAAQRKHAFTVGSPGPSENKPIEQNHYRLNCS